MFSDKLLHSSASGFGSRDAFARTDCSFFQAVSNRRLSATELPSVPTAAATTTTTTTSPSSSSPTFPSELNSPSPPLLVSASEAAVCESASDVMSKKVSSASAAVSASKKDDKIVVSFNSDDSDEEDVKTVTIKKSKKPPPSSEEEETSSSEEANSSSEDSSEEESEKEKSVDGEADVEDDDDTPTFTLTIQPSVASNPVDDALPDVVSSTPTSTTAPVAVAVTTTTNGKAADVEDSSEEEESEDEKEMQKVVKETHAEVVGTTGNGKGKFEEEIVLEKFANKGESKSIVIEEMKEVKASEQTMIETKEKKKSKRGNTSEITENKTEISDEVVDAGKAVKKSSKSTKAEKIIAVAAADQDEDAATGSLVEKVKVEKENGEDGDSTAVELRNVEITHNPERRQSEIAFELVITESMIAEFEKNGTPLIQNTDDAAEEELNDVTAEFTLTGATSNADEVSTAKPMAEAIQTVVEKQEKAAAAPVQHSVVTAENSETVTEVIRKKTTKKSKSSKTSEVEAEEPAEKVTKTKSKKTSRETTASEDSQAETVSVVSVDDAAAGSNTAGKGNVVESSERNGHESVEETVAIVKVISTEIVDEEKSVEVTATTVEKKEQNAAAAADGVSVELEAGTAEVAPKEKKTKKTKASKLAEIKSEDSPVVLDSISSVSKDFKVESESNEVKSADDVTSQSEIKTMEKSPATIKVETEKVEVLNTETSSVELGKVKAAFDLVDGNLGQSNGSTEVSEVKTTSSLSSGSVVEASAGLIKDDVVDSNGITGLANEESGYKVRRNSIDDFIKKILAEAREEQKKLLDSVASASPDAPKTTSGSTTGTASDAMTSAGGTMVNGGTDLDSELTLGKSKFLSSTFTGGDSLLTNGFSSANGSARKATVEADIDSELADIGKYLTTRSRTKYDEFNDLENVQTGDVEGGISAIKMQTIAGMDDENAWRPFERREFTPLRREETSQVVQQSVRPVRALFDQQLNIIHNLKAAARQLDELDNEIREVLRKSAERRTFYETARNDLLEEARLYDGEQRAANERIDQQHLPGGRRFVREEFIRQCSAVDGRRPGWARGISAAASSDDQDGSASSFRRRSGSVSGGFASTSAAGTDDMSSRIQQLLRASGVDVTSRRSVEPDAIESSTMAAITASRQRRAVSVLSERSYGATQDSEQQQSQRRGSISNNSYYRPSSNITSTNDLYSSSASSSRYGSYGGVSGYSSGTPSSYYTSTVRSRAGSAAPSSDYLDDDEDFGGGTSSYSSSTMSSLTARPLGATGEVYYSYSADTSSRPSASAYSSYASSSTPSYTSRFQRSYSAAPESSSTPMSSSSLSSSSYTPRRYASNASSGTSAYGSSSAAGSGSSDGGEFHSRFLEKVRQKKALEGTSSTSSQPTASASSSSADAGFRSRFLRTVDSGSSTTRSYDSHSYSRP